MNASTTLLRPVPVDATCEQRAHTAVLVHDRPTLAIDSPILSETTIHECGRASIVVDGTTVKIAGGLGGIGCGSSVSLEETIGKHGTARIVAIDRTTFDGSVPYEMTVLEFSIRITEVCSAASAAVRLTPEKLDVLEGDLAIIPADTADYSHDLMETWTNAVVIPADND